MFYRPFLWILMSMKKSQNTIETFFSLYHYTLVCYLWPVLHSELHEGLSSFKHQWQPAVF